MSDGTVMGPSETLTDSERLLAWTRNHGFFVWGTLSYSVITLWAILDIWR